LNPAVLSAVRTASEVARFGPGDRHAFTGDGTGNEEGARLDAIGDDGVLGAMEFSDSLDLDVLGTSTGDFRTHGGEEGREINDLRLLRGTSMMVVPSARTAAIMTLPVPKTVGP